MKVELLRLKTFVRLCLLGSCVDSWHTKGSGRNKIYAEVVTRVAGSLEAEGLPGSPQFL